MSDYIFQSPSTRYTRVEAFDSQSQLQNSGEIASITDVTNNFFVPQDVQSILSIIPFNLIYPY